MATTQTNNKLYDPFVLARTVIFAITGVALVYSGWNIYHDALRFGIPPGFAIVMPLLLDGFQVGIYLIVQTRSERGQNSPWQWWGISLVAAFALALNADYYLAYIPHDVGVLGFAFVGPMCLFFGLKFLAKEYQLISLEKTQPVQLRARNYWVEHEVTNGRKVTGSELGNKLGIPTRTATLWLKNWRADGETNSQVA